MKLGIMSKNLGATDLGYYIIQNCNEALKKHKDLSIVGFYDDLSRHCLTPNFACMHSSEAYGFDGILIATSFKTLKSALTFPSPTKKYLYAWDIDWLRMRQKQFEDLFYVYSDKNVELICRSKEHAELFENCWNKKCKAIIEDFDIDKILEVIKC